MPVSNLFKSQLPRGSDADRAFHARDTLRFLSTYFGAAAAAIWRANGGLRETPVPTCEEDWRRLLSRALGALRRRKNPIHGRHLLAVFSSGRHKRWLAHSEQPSDGLDGVMADWLAAAQDFFGHWRPDPDAAVLHSDEGSIDLAPLLCVADCPDCDATGQWFALAGIRRDGRPLYRNMHLGHVVTLPGTMPMTDVAVEPCPIPAGVHRPFEDDADRVVPEAILSRLRRAVAEQGRGYAIVSGPDGSGKSWLARFLAADARFTTAYAWAGADPSWPASVWLQELDSALRRTPGTCRLPAPQFAHFLSSEAGPPELQLKSYLSALVEINGGPVMLVVDDAHGWPQSAGYWPLDLPDQVFVVLFSDAMPRQDALLEAGALSIRLSDPRFESRTRQLAQKGGVETGTGSPVDWLTQRWGESAVRARLAPMLLRLAATGPIPIDVLRDQTGDEAIRDVLHQAGFLVRAGQTLALAHESLVPALRAAWPGLYEEACQQLAWWAQHSADCPFAQDNLWRWVRDSKNTLVATRLPSPTLPDDPHRAWRIASTCHDTLAPLLARDHPGLRTEDAVTVALQRLDLLNRLGAWTEAWQAAGHLVGYLTERLRDGQVASRVPLARALVQRASSALHRDMATSAVDDCKRALELYDLEQAHPERTVDIVQVAEARWVLGRALAVTEGPTSAVLPLEQALSLFSAWEGDRLPEVFYDLATVYMRTGQAVDADICCTLALEAQPSAPGLSRRSVIRSMLGREADAHADAEAAVRLYQELLADVRLDVMAEAAQSWHEVATLRESTPGALEAVSEAIRLGERVVEAYGQPASRPLLARAYNQRGLLHGRQGDLEACLHDFTLAIDLGTILLERERRSHLRSDLAQSHNNRALAFARKGEPSRALRDYQQAIAHYEVLVVRQRRSEFRHHLALVHYNRAGLHRHDDLASARRDYSRAIDLLTEVLRDRDSVDGRRDLAAALANRGLAASLAFEATQSVGDYSQAIAILTDLREAGCAAVIPELAAARHGLGNTYARQRLFAESIREYDLCLAMTGGQGPVCTAATLDRGRSHLALSRWDAAVDDFERCLPSPAAYVGLGRARHGRGDVDEAHAAFDIAISQLEGKEDVEQQATALMLRGRLEDAVRIADAACRKGRHGAWPAVVRNERARRMVDLGQFDTVVDDTTATLHLLPRLQLDREDGARLLAETLALRGRAMHGLDREADAIVDYAGSIEAYTRVVEDAHRPTDSAELARVYRARGQAYRTLGQWREAVCDFGWSVDLLREATGRTQEVAEVYSIRAYALLDAERFEEALHDFQEAVRLGLPESEMRAAMRVCEQEACRVC